MNPELSKLISLYWMHTHFVGFVMSWLMYSRMCVCVHVVCMWIHAYLWPVGMGRNPWVFDMGKPPILGVKPLLKSSMVIRNNPLFKITKHFIFCYYSFHNLFPLFSPMGKLWIYVLTYLVFPFSMRGGSPIWHVYSYIHLWRKTFCSFQKHRS